MKGIASAHGVDDAFALYRMEGALDLHRTAMILVWSWLAVAAVGWRSELLLEGLLWPLVYKIKLTVYLTIGAIHGGLFLAFRESEARYVFGALGSLTIDSAHLYASLLVACGMAFDDQRIIRTLDRNESYARQMSASFARTPDRVSPSVAATRATATATSTASRRSTSC
jgi:hypothetical protein